MQEMNQEKSHYLKVVLRLNAQGDSVRRKLLKMQEKNKKIAPS
jgi:hypothetical protein